LLNWISGIPETSMLSFPPQWVFAIFLHILHPEPAAPLSQRPQYVAFQEKAGFRRFSRVAPGARTLRWLGHEPLPNSPFEGYKGDGGCFHLCRLTVRTGNFGTSSNTTSRHRYLFFQTPSPA
jgi:hypothetical protein